MLALYLLSSYIAAKITGPELSSSPLLIVNLSTIGKIGLEMQLSKQRKQRKSGPSLINQKLTLHLKINAHFYSFGFIGKLFAVNCA